MTTALRRFVFVLLVAVVASYAFVQLRGPQGVPALLEKRRLVKDLEQQNRQLEEEIAQLDQLNKDLDAEDPEVVDVFVRGVLNKMKADEKDFRFSRETQKAKPAPAPPSDDKP